MIRKLSGCNQIRAIIIAMIRGLASNQFHDKIVPLEIGADIIMHLIVGKTILYFKLPEAALPDRYLTLTPGLNTILAFSPILVSLSGL